MTAATLHECFTQPTNSDAIVWRYMDLSKYIDFLCDSRIYFPRADLLGDPFEASIPRFNSQMKQYLLERRRIDPSVEFYRDLPDDQILRMEEQMSLHRRSAVRDYYVSCWHMNEHESAAMWKVYSKSDESICISTRYQTLVQLIPEYVLAGVVKYIDYNNEMMPEGNMLYTVMHKRKSFDYEREARLVIWRLAHNTPRSSEVSPPGMTASVDINSLVSRVFINPTAPNWFATMVESVTQKLGGTFSVGKSSLADAPVY